MSEPSKFVTLVDETTGAERRMDYENAWKALGQTDDLGFARWRTKKPALTMRHPESGEYQAFSSAMLSEMAKAGKENVFLPTSRVAVEKGDRAARKKALREVAGKSALNVFGTTLGSGATFGAGAPLAKLVAASPTLSALYGGAPASPAEIDEAFDVGIEENPIAAVTGELIGAFVPIIISGGASVLGASKAATTAGGAGLASRAAAARTASITGKAGALSTKVAQAEIKASLAAAKAADQLNKSKTGLLLAKYGGEVGLTGETASAMVKTLGKGAAMNAWATASFEASHAVDNNKPLSAEALASAVAMDLALGGAITGAGLAVRKGVGAARRILAGKVGREVLDETKRIKGLSKEQIIKESDPSDLVSVLFKKEATTAAKRANEDFNKTALDSVMLNVRRTLEQAREDVSTLVNMSGAASKGASLEIRRYNRAIRNVDRIIAARPNLDLVELKTIVDNAKRSPDDMSILLDTLRQRGGARVPTGELNVRLNHITDAELEDLRQLLLGALEGAAEVLESVPGTGAANWLKKNVQRYARMRTSDAVATGVAMKAGDTVNDITGGLLPPGVAAMGGGLVFLAAKQATARLTKGSADMARKFYNHKVRSHIVGNTLGVGYLLKGVSAGMKGATTSAGSTAMRGIVARGRLWVEDDEIKAEQEEVARMMGNPELLQKHLEEVAAPYIDDAQLANDIQQVEMRRLMALRDASPRQTKSIGRVETKASPSELRKYRRVREIVETPQVVAQKYMEGSLTAADVSVLRRVYPNLHAEYVHAVVEGQMVREKTTTRREREQLAALLGGNIDTIYSPKAALTMELARASNMPAQEQQRTRKLPGSAADGLESSLQRVSKL